MKSSEEAIEKVLAGLRDTDAPVGMERRILEALEERVSERSRASWRVSRPIWLLAPRSIAIGSLACGVALGGLVAMTVAIPAIRRLGRAPAEAKRSSDSVRPLPAAASVIVATSAPLPAPVHRVRLTRKAHARIAIAHDGDSAALSKMRSDSFPAPPMPLTEQERLLLRIAHKGDPVELAALDPVMRAARDAEEKAEVERFFMPSTTGQRKTGDNE